VAEAGGHHRPLECHQRRRRLLLQEDQQRQQMVGLRRMAHFPGRNGLEEKIEHSLFSEENFALTYSKRFKNNKLETFYV